MKQAVAFVLDASPCMQQPFPDEGHTGGTRLSASKRAMQSMILELITSSKQNEVLVIVIHARDSSDVKVDDALIHFPNVNLLTERQTTPNADLIRRISEIEVYSEELFGVSKATLLDTIPIVTAMFQPKGHLLYDRRIVLFTDAEFGGESKDFVQCKLNESLHHHVRVLRSIGCRFDVMGIDFILSTKVHGRPATPTTGRSDTDEDAEDEGTMDDDNDHEDDELDDGMTMLSKEDRQKLLHGYTWMLSGALLTVHSFREMLDANDTRQHTKIPNKSKVQLVFAPGLSCEAKQMSMATIMKPASVYHFREEALPLDQDGLDVMESALVPLGEGVKLEKQSFFYSDGNPDKVIEKEDTASATMYLDFHVNLTPDERDVYQHIASVATIKILGYVPSDKVPFEYMIAQPYLVWGADSFKACVMIAAAADAMHQESNYAICKFNKTKTSSPVLGVLRPVASSNSTKRLCFHEIPRGGMINDVPSFEVFQAEDDEKDVVCDQLIEDLMIGDDDFMTGSFPNPCMRAWNLSFLSKLLDPRPNDKTSHSQVDNDNIFTNHLSHSVDSAQVTRFREAFDLHEGDSPYEKAM